MNIYKTVLGNIKNIENSSLPHVEKLFLSPDDLLKKVIVATTDHGNEVGVVLEDNKLIEDGDIIFQDDHNIIAIFKTNTDVLIIKPMSIKEMGIIAHNLGNRHSPAQFTDTEMLVPYDYLIEDYLKSIGALYERKAIKLEQAFRHVDGAK
ncbi:urease accessory protein UreE [Ureaplasma ceti]|uniref:Urease accessory protein UreE n=1 Tax=Ureaplasma ceti TaxID=3119530 RepID=A0ABP9U595_9BACT